MQSNDPDIINHLADQENAIAALYSAFAVALPEHADFWNDLVIQEKAHGDVLRKLAELCETDDVYLNASKFRPEAIQTNIQNMENQIAKVTSQGITPIRAFALAADIEHSLIETGYFQVIETNTPHIKKELDELARHTKQHIKLAEEGLNNARAGAASAPKNVSENVAAAQASIINHLALCEEAISEVYKVYAETIPSMEAFWNELSRKEKVHAELLRSLLRQIAKGHIFQNLDKFKLSDIKAFLKRTKDAVKDAEENQLTEEQAIKISIGIESSVLDAHFYDIVTTDASEYKIIADRLSSDTHAHVKAVQDKLLQIQSKNKSQN